MFPPSLFDYVTNDLKKHMILVMNKVDLVESKIVLAWKKYFEEVYPNVRVVLFTSYPGYCLRNASGITECTGMSNHFRLAKNLRWPEFFTGKTFCFIFSL